MSRRTARAKTQTTITQATPEPWQDRLASLVRTWVTCAVVAVALVVASLTAISDRVAGAVVTIGLIASWCSHAHRVRWKLRRPLWLMSVGCYATAMPRIVTPLALDWPRGTVFVGAATLVLVVMFDLEYVHPPSHERVVDQNLHAFGRDLAQRVGHPDGSYVTATIDKGWAWLRWSFPWGLNTEAVVETRPNYRIFGASKVAYKFGQGHESHIVDVGLRFGQPPAIKLSAFTGADEPDTLRWHIGKHWAAVGNDDDAEEHIADLVADLGGGARIAVFGVPRSGKSTLLRGAAATVVAHKNAGHSVELWATNLTGDGAVFKPWADAYAEGGAGVQRLVERLHDEIERRKAASSESGGWTAVELGMHPIVLIVDEIGSWIDEVGATTALPLVRYLIREGRKANVSVVLSGHRPTKEHMPTDVTRTLDFVLSTRSSKQDLRLLWENVEWPRKLPAIGQGTAYFSAPTDEPGAAPRLVHVWNVTTDWMKRQEAAPAQRPPTAGRTAGAAGAAAHKSRGDVHGGPSTEELRSTHRAAAEEQRRVTEDAAVDQRWSAEAPTEEQQEAGGRRFAPPVGPVAPGHPDALVDACHNHLGWRKIPGASRNGNGEAIWSALVTAPRASTIADLVDWGITKLQPEGTRKVLAALESAGLVVRLPDSNPVRYMAVVSTAKQTLDTLAGGEEYVTAEQAMSWRSSDEGAA